MMANRKPPNSRSQRSILEMTHSEARDFLLKPESYCNVELPNYFQFGTILSDVSNELSRNPLDKVSKKPRQHEGVNYDMLSNKDGRHAWRPFQLIHPALYVSLTEKITAKDHWKVLRDRFKEFQQSSNFDCLSMPLQSMTKKKDKAAQILTWWQGIEQRSIELALEYSYVFHADIADCYAAIYTHSIAWAVHGKRHAKKNRTDKNLIGNAIDAHIQDMRHGQTNGIPQGSVLTDFVSELVLGYADLKLGKRLDDANITDYRVLRYRDDYRIFVNNPQSGEVILKELTEVLIDLGLKLNTDKTTGSQSIVSNSIKPDKRAWLLSKQRDLNLQKHLLVIHAHGMDYPNGGSLAGALSDFHKRLNETTKIRSLLPLISIAVDIAYTSPRVFPTCAAIVSKALSVLDSDVVRCGVIEKIYKKLSQLPNTGHMEIWLQRISHPYGARLSYREPLCQLVCGRDVIVWNNDWITSTKLRTALDPKKIVNRQRLKTIKPVVRPSEIRVFEY